MPSLLKGGLPPPPNVGEGNPVIEFVIYCNERKELCHLIEATSAW